jgi:SAM-dependent methyltransferase
MSARAAPVTQYDAIAPLYRRSRGSPIRRFVEAPTLLGLAGDVAGLRVLDLACGEGCYARTLREAGAARVLGVDVSPAMVALARESEAARPLGIDYAVHDAAALPDLGPFDLVVAAHLLHYARDRAELAAMCRGIARQLAPGGRFVALNENPRQDAARYAGYLQYGFAKRSARSRGEGAPITYDMVSGRELYAFTVYHHEAETYEACLAEAGFADVRWHPLRLDPAGVAERGDAYWREYLDNPPIVGLSARRGSAARVAAARVAAD